MHLARVSEQELRQSVDTKNVSVCCSKQTACITKSRSHTTVAPFRLLNSSTTDSTLSNTVLLRTQIFDSALRGVLTADVSMQSCVVGNSGGRGFGPTQTTHLNPADPNVGGTYFHVTSKRPMLSIGQRCMDTRGLLRSYFVVWANGAIPSWQMLSPVHPPCSTQPHNSTTRCARGKTRGEIQMTESDRSRRFVASRKKLV